jgi:hypothetical protein
VPRLDAKFVKANLINGLFEELRGFIKVTAKLYGLQADWLVTCTSVGDVKLELARDVDTVINSLVAA